MFHGITARAGNRVSYQKPTLLWVIGLLGIFGPEMALLLQEMLLVPLPSKQVMVLLIRKVACR